MKKVLIVTYYWPPAGGGGVQRWLKFVKYLSQTGWEPIVYRPENAEYPIEDRTLNNEITRNTEIIGTSIFEPRKAFKRLFSGEKVNTSSVKDHLDNLFYIPSENRKWYQNLAIWIRANLFIPDARVTWVKPSIKFLSKYIRENNIDNIITTGPPHSLHLIGLELKKRNPGLKWVADFRDPWMEIEYFDLLPLTRRSLRIHQKLESEVLLCADRIITVSPSWAEMFRQKGAPKVDVITNGFDPVDFDIPPAELPKKFRICHVGTLALDRNPIQLWEALSKLIDDGLLDPDKIEIALVGKTDPLILTWLSQSPLKNSYYDYKYVDHQLSIQLMKSSDVLLLLLNKGSKMNSAGRIPGKVFEYIASKRKILMIGDLDSDVAKIVRVVGGDIVDYDGEGLYTILRLLYENYLIGQPIQEIYEDKAFHRSKLTIKLIEILSELDTPIKN